VAYAWAISLSQEEAASLLRRLNLAEAVVDYAVEAGAFPHAFQLAQVVAKGKLPDVHLKYAMFLEDSGRFQEAEGEFLNAGALLLLVLVHIQPWLYSVCHGSTALSSGLMENSLQCALAVFRPFT
jgi:intraflagellar transport protein 172